MVGAVAGDFEIRHFPLGLTEGHHPTRCTAPPDRLEAQALMQWASPLNR